MEENSNMEQWRVEMLYVTHCLCSPLQKQHIHKLFLVLVDKGREDPITTKSSPSSDHQRNAIKWRFAGTQMVA